MDPIIFMNQTLGLNVLVLFNVVIYFPPNSGRFNKNEYLMQQCTIDKRTTIAPTQDYYVTFMFTKYQSFY